jgi:putative NADH-flavin reductase
MSSQDAVVSALGAGKSIVSDLYPPAADAVTGAMRQAGVSRLVWMSSFGVGNTLREANVTQQLLYRTMLRSIYAQKQIADDHIRTSGLDWTVVYPVGLTHGAATGAYRVGEHLPMTGYPTVSRADVATFMLDAARGGEWVRRCAAISD